MNTFQNIQYFRNKRLVKIPIKRKINSEYSKYSANNNKQNNIIIKKLSDTYGNKDIIEKLPNSLLDDLNYIRCVYTKDYLELYPYSASSLKQLLCSISKRYPDIYEKNNKLFLDIVKYYVDLVI
jgi:hypothetical protein